MPPLVSYLIVTRNRHRDLREALDSILFQKYDPKEIIVVDNGSEDETRSLLQNEFNRSKIRYIRSEVNRGVCGGRNLGLDHVEGEIILNLDDDAVMRDERATEKIVKKFEADSEIGLLAFRIVEYGTGALEKGAFPSKNKDYDSRKEFETTWFIGAGYAISSEVFKRVGYFRDFYPYGHEEIDLSFRIIEAGYKIIYYPDIQIFHKKIETGRLMTNSRFQAMQLYNRIKVAMYNLPARFVVTTAAARSIQVLIMTRGNIVPILIASWKIITNLLTIWKSRRVLSNATISKILRMKGPILY